MKYAPGIGPFCTRTGIDADCSSPAIEWISPPVGYFTAVPTHEYEALKNKAQQLEKRLEAAIAVCRNPPSPSRMLIPFMLEALFGVDEWEDYARWSASYTSDID